MFYITVSPMQSGMKPVWVLGIIMFTIGMLGENTGLEDAVLAHVIGIMMAGTWNRQTRLTKNS